jgi:RNA polymerase sigma-70 factor (sigma-E family)
MSVEHGAEADDAAAFHAFFERHYAELARLAHLLTGEADTADDLAADALVALWRHWDRVRAAEHPVAYARGVVANLARSRIRSAVRERRRVALFWSQRAERVTEQPDVPAVLDLREALQRLPFRKRACVVLRHAFDLSEKDTAEALGISVGTVKSQTSRGVAELERLLAQPAEPPLTPRPAPAPAPAPVATAATGRAPAPAKPPAPAPVRPLDGADAVDAVAPRATLLAAQHPAETAELAAPCAGDRGGEPEPEGDGEGAEPGRQARTGDSTPARGSAPAAGTGAEPGAAARLLGSERPTARPRTHTGRELR